MTITFNKPIRIPPIDVYSDDSEARLLKSETVSTGEKPSNFTINDVLSFAVDSPFYSQDDPEVGIRDVQLTEITEDRLEVNIKFQQPEKLALNKKESDQLIMSFRETSSYLFIGKDDFSGLDSQSLYLSVDMPRQMTEEQLQAI